MRQVGSCMWPMPVGLHTAVIYWVIGIPVAWILWYIRLYNAAKKDAAFTYAWFFLAYLVHIFWCIWSAVCAPISPSTPHNSAVMLQLARL